jgi:hypothetical protein
MAHEGKKICVASAANQTQQRTKNVAQKGKEETVSRNENHGVFVGDIGTA